MSVPKIKIRRWNPEILEVKRLAGYTSTCVVFGKKSTGKSTLIADLLWHIRKIPMVIAMSGSEEGNGFFGKFLHPLCIHGEYKKEIVSSLIKSQHKEVTKTTKSGIDPNTRPQLGMGLILDDCGYDKKILTQKDIRQIFMNGRHWKIFFIMGLQYMMGVPPDLRTQIDYVFCLRENILSNQKKLYENFFGVFGKFDHFREALIECTENYECLVLDNTSKSNKVEECVYFYKATPGRNFKIGSAELWNYLDSRYKETDEDDDNDCIISKGSISIKKGPMVKIVDRT